MSDITVATTGDRTAFCSSVKADAWQARSAEKAYEWWYFDALSDDGREAVVIVFTDNYVFSPRYAAARDPARPARLRTPAVSFLYSVDGKVVFRTVSEFTERQFCGSTESVECSIGDSSFRLDSAEYGSGYFVTVDVPLGANRRLKATFEWLSIEADLLPADETAVGMPSFWNMVATRSDVSGKIEFFGRTGKLKRQVHFRGTGYHDHVAGDAPLHDTIRTRQWGRAHFTDCTAIFSLQSGPDEAPEGKLFVVRDGAIRERNAGFEESRFRRDRYGIKFPTRLRFLTEDNIRLRVKPLKVIDSNFYDLRLLSEMTLMLRDGKPRRAIGITEFLAPKNMKYRLFRWFSGLKIGKSGKGPIF